jgi:uncharacterized delta-60 repeat protein
MKKIRVLIIVFLINLISGISFSQVWNGTGEPMVGDEKAFAVTIDKKANIYVTGYSYDFTGGNNFCTIMYSKQGVQQWVATYNRQGSGEDKAYAITVDKFGNVYVTGYSTGTTSQHDIATIKYNSHGVQQWVATYNGPGNRDDEGYSIVLDEDANVYITGFATGSNGNPDMCTIKYNTNGIQQWVKIFNGTGNGEDKAYAITIDNSDNIYITGYSTRNSIDYTSIKYNPSGTQQWVAYFNGSGNGEDKAYAITVDKDNFIYITGYSASSNGSIVYATIKYSSAGTQNWVAYYGGSAGTTSQAQAIAVDKHSNVYVTGASKLTVSGSFDYATIKYNSAGTQQWVARYNGRANGDDIANSLMLDNSNNNILVTGQSKGKGLTSLCYHYATLDYNTDDGVKQWEAIYTTSRLDDIASQVVLDKQGNSYVTGYSFVSGKNSDYATVKYDNSGAQQWVARYSGLSHGNPSGQFVEGGENVSNSVGSANQQGSLNQIILPEKFMLYQNYPNPFNPSTTIKFDVSKTSYVKVVVYNTLGEQVATLIDGYRDQGQYEVQFHPSNLTSGVYFFEMKTEKYRDIKKMLFIK